MPRRKDDHPRFLRYLDLRDPEWAPIEKLHREVYPGRSIQTVVQELIRIGLSHDPFQPAVMTARRAAYASTSVEIRVKLAQALRSISNDLETGAAADLSGLGPGAAAAHETGEYFQP